MLLGTMLLKTLVLASVTALSLAKICLQNRDQDFLKTLPFLPENETITQYSGYLDASKTHKFFYWLVVSEKHTKRGNGLTGNKDPLIVWLNGGPGCSSLDGLLNENGPYLVDKYGEKLRKNEFSWNKLANVLYLESPVGVGFSISTDPKENFTKISTNENTAQENYAALKDFFQKFPELRENSLYVAGESYGGVYAPMLSEQILNNRKNYKVNLKGLMVGNGFLDAKDIARGRINFLIKNGLLNKDINIEQFLIPKFQLPENLIIQINSALKLVKPCVADRNFCNFKAMNRLFQRYMLTYGVNMYNVHEDCAPKLEQDRSGFPCVSTSGIVRYLQDPAVLQSIHINQQFNPFKAIGRVSKWGLCSSSVANKFNASNQLEGADMSNQIRQALKCGIKVLIYNGASDSICPYTAAEDFVNRLSLKKTKDTRFWFFNDETDKEQVGGSITEFGNLKLVTVKGAGHAVPRDKPREAFQMLKDFGLI